MVYETHRTNTKKRGFEALASPFPSERATLKPTPICISTQTCNHTTMAARFAVRITYPHRTSTVALSLTRIETARFQKGQEQSVNIVNAFP